nr:U32 family peptidase [Tissierella sp.]
MQKVNYNLELLAPVGSMEALHGAVANGADAVYLGGKLFNARHFANNFSNEELKEVIKYAHLNNVRVYITVNILIDNKEMERALDYIRFLYEEDVDAIIVQDLGLARNVRALFPDLDIHASTQMTINNLEGVELLEEIGFKRVVLARETPLEEIKRIRKSSSMELEGFIHGALCVSYSGQCIMSSVIGGRSGNRGMCAQPCRMPYSIMDKDGELLDDWQELHLLSPKDLNTLDYIDEIIDAGVNSLKIEGRMKRPEYVATIVDTYRGIIDKNAKATKEQKDDVRQIFNRGFTKGVGLGDFGRDFITMDRPDNRGTVLGTVVNANRDSVFILLEQDLKKDDGIEFSLVNGKNKGMKAPKDGKKGETLEIKKIGNIRTNSVVHKSSSIDLLERAQASYEEEKNIYPIDMEISVKIGQKPSLQIRYKDYQNINDVDFIVEAAKNKGLASEKIEEQLSKLGDTQFSLNSLNIVLDDNSFLPLSVLNELRRDGCQLLNDALQNIHARVGFDNKEYIQKKKEVLKFKKHETTMDRLLSIKIDRIEQIYDLDLNKLDRIYLPLKDDLIEVLETLNKKDVEVFVATPKIIYGGGMELLKARLDPIKKLIDGVSVENIGTLKFVKENYDLKIHGDMGLNVFNSYSVDFFKELGLGSMTLSPELNLTQIKQLERVSGGNLEAIVYGYLPVMTTKTCPMALVKGCKDDSECENCNFAHGYGLNDRKNMTFYTARGEGFTTIYNSVPLMVLDSMDQIYSAGVGMGRLDFTIETENIKEIQTAYRRYIDHIWNEKEAREFIDTMKDDTEITKGHFFRGVL